MAFTVYGLTSTATPPGPYQNSSTDVTAITGGNPAVGAYLYGFVSGMQLSKFFYSSAGGTLALPQFVTPNALPTGATQIGTSAIYQSQYTDTNNNLRGGALYFAVQPQPGSPDAGSPQQFEVDPYTIFLVASSSSAYEWV